MTYSFFILFFYLFILLINLIYLKRRDRSHFFSLNHFSSRRFINYKIGRNKS